MRTAEPKCPLPPIAVRAVRSVLPGRDLAGSSLDNARLAELVDEVRRRLAREGVTRDVPACSPEFPSQRIGVESRCVLDVELSVRDMALLAAQRAMDASGIAPDTVCAVIVCSVTPHKVVPALATSVADRLGLGADVTAFDLTLGCNAFPVAIDVAARMIAPCAPGCSALVVAAETMTRVLDASDRTTCPIFGDGAGALVLQRGEEASLTEVRTTTFGASGPRIEIRPAPAEHGPVYRFVARGGDLGVRVDETSRNVVAMDGRRVFRDMVRMLPERLGAYLGAQGLGVDDVDRFAFHQANARLIEAVAASPQLPIPSSKLLMNIAHVGNTTSASIPILLDEAAQRGDLCPGERLLIAGFGTGYSVGITTWIWS